jgi:hypothetical protein
VYRVVPDEATVEQVAALPVTVLADYLEVLIALGLTPWNGSPHNEANPDGAVRRWAFGPDAAGHVVYLIDEDRRAVHLLVVQWLR